MMDGYALRAANTLGAGVYNPLTLEIVGEVLPGDALDADVRSGEAARIMTGAPLPRGADAVLPAEKSISEDGRLTVVDEVSPGKHVGEVGEDVSAGAVVLDQGRRLRPQDLGVLSSIGCARVAVVRRPRIRLLVTGNELSPAGTRPEPHQTVDANSPMLTALIRRDGGQVLFDGITPDDPDKIRLAMQDAQADVVVVSGGSSVGQEDHAPRILAELGELAIHGIAMRPSSPMGLGFIGPRLVFLLPGNPVSCLCGYDHFTGRAIRLLGGRSPEWPYRRRSCRLGRKLSSVVGRQDYARVGLAGGEVQPLAIGGASVLSSTTRADGFVIVPADSEGYPAGAEVEVFLYDETAVGR
jgi:molybdopterin molybdotransferase